MVVKDPWIRALVIVMLAIAAVYLIGMLWQLAVEFADLILLFFLAWIIAFMLEPLVTVLQNRGRLPRVYAVMASYLAVLVVVSVGIVQLVPVEGRVPVDVAVDRLGVRVEQQLVRVAAVPAAGLVRPVHPVAVALAGADAGQVAVPDEPVGLGERDPGLRRGRPARGCGRRPPPRRRPAG